MAPLANFYQRVKNGIHALQALIIFIGAATTIAVYAKSGQGDRRINYYFALCWLCIPALVYQTAFPIFQRTKRFANPYAHAVVDSLYTILWFAAFIAVVVWVKRGSHLAKDWDSKDHLCDKFAWGSTNRCRLGQATAALGAIVCLLFGLTTALSVYGILYYRKTGSLPASTTKTPEIIAGEDQEDYAFSSDTHDKLDEREEMHPMHHESDEVSSLHISSEGGAHHDTRLSWERRPTPELPMHQEIPIGWSRPPTSGSSTHQDEIVWDRQRTPDLPVGEGYYPVDTSYHGGEQILYDPPQQVHPSTSFGRTPSRQYDYHTPYEDNSVEHLKPQTGVDASENVMRFSWEHDEHDTHNRVLFPEAEYNR